MRCKNCAAQHRDAEYIGVSKTIPNITVQLGVGRMSNGEDLSLGDYGFVSDNIEALLYAAVNKMGITFAPPAFISSQVDGGLLVRVLPAVFLS